VVSKKGKRRERKRPKAEAGGEEKTEEEAALERAVFGMADPGMLFADLHAGEGPEEEEDEEEEGGELGRARKPQAAVGTGVLCWLACGLSCRHTYHKWLHGA
jgi:hypothetical protein